MQHKKQNGSELIQIIRYVHYVHFFNINKRAKLLHHIIWVMFPYNLFRIKLNQWNVLLLWFQDSYRSE